MLMMDDTKCMGVTHNTYTLSDRNKLQSTQMCVTYTFVKMMMGLIMMMMMMDDTKGMGVTHV